jgi:signal transduction histidine kinase
VSATGGRRPRPLAWRLGLVLGIAVLGVLLVVGVVVNRVVSQGFQTVVTGAQEQRLDDAATTLADRWDRPARVAALIRRVAMNLGGEITLVGSDGATIAAVGLAPDRDVASYETPVVVDGRTVATLKARLPGSGTDRGFLPLFNTTLVVAGLVSVLAIAVISTIIAGRLTRPLSDVAAAARRLERGETSARATGGDDRESAELAEAFNSMADRLERSEMLRRRAASDLAHDLATPATVLETQLQAMIDGVVPSDAANLEAARTAASSLAGLVGALGDLASAEAAPLAVRPGPVDVAAACAEVTGPLEGLARARSVRLVTDVEGRPIAWADPVHVARALQNVVANAIDHSPAGSTVTIAVAPAPSTDGAPATSVEFRIRDEGPGIEPEDVPHVFERFYRADPARTSERRPNERPTDEPPADGADGARPSGHGLGLTIARELLAANGGAIAVESTGPGGTTFRIVLPAAGRAG